jgi:hypothetical protein
VHEEFADAWDAAVYRYAVAKEAIFFEELAATANASRAAAAVGMSKNAVLQRRLRHPVFAVWVRCEAPAG